MNVSGVPRSEAGRLPLSWTAVALVLGVLAYAPALKSGFISDDYVILSRIDGWMKDFTTFALPPEGIRLTLYSCFALLRKLFGLRPAFFYAFAIMLHLFNVWLLGRFLLLLTSRKSVAVVGSVLFAVFQNPQEAVMWLAAMSDALAGAFILASLLSWLRERHFGSAVWYAAALLSKESGIALLALVPLVDWVRSGQFRLRRSYLILLVPTAGFLALFLTHLRSDSFVLAGLYVVRPFGAVVLLNSAHRLAFPWLYIALLLCLIASVWRWTSEVAAFCAWIFVTLAPYSFITYQSHVPSRSQYLAAMGVAAVLAILVDSLPGRVCGGAFLTAFVVVNIGYLWMVKRPQYVRREMPTELLLKELRARTPSCMEVREFPLNPWIAKDTTMLVPGWRPEMLAVNEPASGRCGRVRWNGALERYEALMPAN